MQNKTLYRYTRPDGGVTVSPVEPGCPYTTSHRLVADEGMILTDGQTVTYCVDTDTPELWSEIPAPEEEEAYG